MIQIAIVDDDQTYRQTVYDYIRRYEQEKNEKFKVRLFTDGDELVENYKADIDILLLDIEMQFMDGMKTAERIRELDREVILIFITNTPQYAMKGYLVDALDYVLKPINYFALASQLDRALERLKSRKKHYLSIAIKGGVQKLEIGSIIYVEVQDHDMAYHTKTGIYMTRMTMAEAEKALEQYHFFRCSKSFLINLEYVDRIHNNEVYLGEQVVLVSRSRKKELLDALNNYINEL